MTTNPGGSTTTTYFVPAQQLPLTQPLTEIGVPAAVTNGLDKALTPMVDAGYRRYDSSDGITAPYLSHGQLVLPNPSGRKVGFVSNPVSKSPVSTPEPGPSLSIKAPTLANRVSKAYTHKQK